MLVSLLDEISLFRLNNPKHEIEVDVYDDCSGFKESFIEGIVRDYDVLFHQTHQNYGKQHHYILWNEDLFNLHRDSADLCIFIPSDLQKVDFDRIVSTHIKFGGENYVVNLVNDGRTMSWNKLSPQRYNKDFMRIFFVDCIFFTNRETLDLLNYQIHDIHPSRFKKSPLVSSGVGQQLTARLNALKVPIYTPYNSIAYHGEHESTMHKELRKIQPLVSKSTVLKSKRIIIGMATMKGREEAFKKALESLQNQTLKADEIIVYDNSKEKVDLTDNGKFYGLSLQTEPCIYLSCDDDIEYPVTYIEDIVSYVQTHRCIVTHHGRKLRVLDRIYYSGHVGYAFNRSNMVCRNIDVAGTGVTAFDTEIFFPREIYKSDKKRMSDLIFSLEASKQKIPIKILRHKKGYLKQIEIDKKNSCYYLEKDDQSVQIEIANQIYKLNNNEKSLRKNRNIQR